MGTATATRLHVEPLRPTALTRAVSCAVLTLAVPSVLAQQTLRLQASVALGANWLDQRRLEQADISGAGWRFDVNPVLGLSYQDQPFKVNFTYNPTLSHDVRTDSSTVVQNLALNTQASLFNRRLQLKLDHRVSESRADPLARDTLTAPDQTRVQSRDWTVGAAWRGPTVFEGILTASAQANLTDNRTVFPTAVDTAASNPANTANSASASQTLRFSETINFEFSPQSVLSPGLRIDGSQFRVREGVSSLRDSHSERALLQLTFTPEREWRIGAYVGYERTSFKDETGRDSGTSAGLRLQWMPSRRTRLNAEVGRSYFGETYTLRFTHQLNRLSHELIASRGVSTPQSRIDIPATGSTRELLDRQLANTVTSATERAAQVNTLIRDLNLSESLGRNTSVFVDTEVLQRLFRYTAVYTGTRFGANISVFDETLVPGANATLSSLGSTTQGQTHQWGGSSQVSYRLTPSSSVSLRGGITRSTVENPNRASRAAQWRFAWTHTPSRNLSYGINFGTSRQTSNDATAAFQERGVGATLSYQF